MVQVDPAARRAELLRQAETELARGGLTGDDEHVGEVEVLAESIGEPVERAGSHMEQARHIDRSGTNHPAHHLGSTARPRSLAGHPSVDRSQSTSVRWRRLNRMNWPISHIVPIIPNAAQGSLPT